MRGIQRMIGHGTSNKSVKKAKITPLIQAESSGNERDIPKKTGRKLEPIPIAQPELNGNEYEYLCSAFQSTWISSKGEFIDRLESEFPTFCDTKYGVSVSNGTVALHLALTALGINAGDEVVVPDFTFAATINAVLHTGATPVIVDVENDSWCMDPEKFKAAISKKTKAVIFYTLQVF